MGTRRLAAVVACLAWTVTACGTDDPDDPGSTSEPSAGQVLELPSEPVFDPGPKQISGIGERPMWSEGSVIHLGDEVHDLTPARVDGFAPTPYGLFVRIMVGRGIDATTEVRFYDGSGPLQPLPAVHDVVVSDSGEYVGWLDREGPLVESHAEGARAWVAVVAETATGRVVYRSTDALLEGADYPDEYSPRAYGFVGDTFYWGDDYTSEVAGVDAATLEEQTSTEGEIEAAVAAPVPGQYDVGAHFEEKEYGAVDVTDGAGRPVEVGYDWVFYLGKVGGPASDRVLLRGQHVDSGELLDDKAPQDGALLDCALESGRCTVVARVADIDEVRGPAPILW